jgi:hypothetical protein
VLELALLSSELFDVVEEEEGEFESGDDCDDIDEEVCDKTMPRSFSIDSDSIIMQYQLF